MLEKYDDNIKLVLAAYNAGSTIVEKYKGIPPFNETTNYTQKVLYTKKLYENTNI